MNSAENIITAVKTVVAAMTPVITITDNQAAGTNWILTMCRTYWVVPNSTIIIGGESFRVQSIVFNESITVSGTAQPIGTTFQLIAPDFVHGSSRKVDNERKTTDDVTNSFVYLPRPRVREDGRYDSDIAYIASIRPLFLVTYDTLKDNTNDQQSDFILPMNAAADLFQNIVDDNNDKFEETEFYNREEWMNFGDPSTWGNDQYIFDAPISGVELSFDLIVLDDFACICDGAQPVTCPDVTTSFQDVDTGVTTSPGGNIDFQVVDQNGTDAGALIVNNANVKRVEVNTGGGDVTSEFNGTPTTTDTPALTNLLINTIDEDNNQIGTLETDLSALKEIEIPSSNVSNSDDSFSVDVLATQNLELADNQMTDSDGTVSNIPAQTAFVCTAASPPITTIAYHRGNWTAKNTPLNTHDLGWYMANESSVFNYTVVGLSPLLDITDKTKLTTLNAFSNLDRITNSLGLTATYDGSNGEVADYAIDHYTGMGWYLQDAVAVNVNFVDASVNLRAATLATYSDWRMLTVGDITKVVTDDGGLPSTLFASIENWSKDLTWIMNSVGTGTGLFWRINQHIVSSQWMNNRSISSASSSIMTVGIRKHY